MEENIRVKVDRKLIHWALQQTSTQCAIALALKDADDCIVRPVVTQKTISFTDITSGQRYTFNTPEKIADWIDTFDKDPSTTRPLSFTLIPTQAARVTARKPRTVERSIQDHQAYEEWRDKPHNTGKPPRTHRPLRPTDG